jgi:hypothetical protein
VASAFAILIVDLGTTDRMAERRYFGFLLTIIDAGVNNALRMGFGHVQDPDCAGPSRASPPGRARWLQADNRVAYSCVMPTKSDPGDIGDVEPLADSTASQARRVVAAYANDADECRVFLSMLGIGPAKLDA